jgi:hypothetical protein
MNGFFSPNEKEAFEERRLKSAIRGSYTRLQNYQDQLRTVGGYPQMERIRGKIDDEQERLLNARAQWDEAHPEKAVTDIRQLINEIDGLGKTAGRVARLVNRAVGIVTTISDYNQRKAQVAGGFNPFNPWSYPETLMGLQGARFDFAQNLGGKLTGVGSSLIMTGTPAGVGLGLAASAAGAGTSIWGSLNKASLANYQGALNIVKTATGGLLEGLNAFLQGVKTVAGSLLSLARNIIGGFSNLFGLSLGLGAAGAGIAANSLRKTFSQSVNWNNQSFTGISLREQLHNEHLEDYWYLGHGAIQGEIVNYNRLRAKFDTEGVFQNQLPAALAGLVPFIAGGRQGFNGIMDMAKYIASIRTDENYTQLENWLSEQNLGVVSHIAGQLLEGRSPQTPWYQYRNAESAERNFRANKSEFDAVGTALQYIFKDISNTIWAKKLPFMDVTGRQIAVQFANMLGAAPLALQGNTKPLTSSIGAFAGMGVRAVDNAGRALDDKTGLGLWQGTKSLIASVIERGLGLADVGLTAAQSGNWTPLWDYMGDQLENVAESAASLMKSAFEQSRPIFTSLWDWIAGKVKAFFNSDFPDTLMRGFHNFSTWMNETLSNVFDSIDTSGLSKWLSGLGVELFHAFQPGLEFIGGALWDIVSGIADAFTFSFNPFEKKEFNPLTLKQDPFLTRSMNEKYERINSIIHVLPTGIPNAAARQTRRIYENKGLESPLLKTPPESVYDNIYQLTGNSYIGNYAMLLAQILQKSKLEGKNKEKVANEFGQEISIFTMMDRADQIAVLSGQDKKKRLETLRDFANLGNPGVELVRSVVAQVDKFSKENGYPSYENEHPPGSDAYRPVDTGRPAPLLSPTPENHALNAVISGLRQTIHDLQNQVKILSEKQDVPLTGFVELKDDKGNFFSVGLTQEALASLNSAYNYRDAGFAGG